MEFLEEGIGESSSPLRSSSPVRGGFDIRNDVFNRLVANGNEQALSNPHFRLQLDSHFDRLPARYGLDVNMDRVEDVLLHQELLAVAKDPEKCPVFHVRFMENLQMKPDGNNDLEPSTTVPSTSRACSKARLEENTASSYRNVESRGDFEPCSKLGDLNLDIAQKAAGSKGQHVFKGQEVQDVPIHEIIFSTIDKPKLLSQLSALLSDIGLNIREAHVFSTVDGYSLDVFVVDGWPLEDTDGLREAVGDAVSRSEGSWSGSISTQSIVVKALAEQLKDGDWEIDRRSLKIGEKIASGSCGDLHHGVYQGNEVAVKVIKSEQLTADSAVEFAQEVTILREVNHRNVVRLVGACTKHPHLCIITEYMQRGSLYDYLRKHHNLLELPLLLKFAIDICKGMEYLHQKSIIHRDLKTANLLMDTENVVKVADFGVARFQNRGGVMTAETGTYRWMAPEVMNHQPYDQKADVFSFAIVLWELTTGKVPYDTLTPIQAALRVRQGGRPELPHNAHPRILDLMQRCWQAVPSDRPSFSEIVLELEQLQQEVSDEPKS